jgi:hypothetical protein
LAILQNIFWATGASMAERRELPALQEEIAVKVAAMRKQSKGTAVPVWEDKKRDAPNK